MNICIISEEMNIPFDEGIKSFGYNLIRKLSKTNNVHAVSIRGYITDDRYIKRLNVNKAFLGYPLFKEIKNFEPEIIIYIPVASATIFSFMRSTILKFYARDAKVIMLALQSRRYPVLLRIFIPFLGFGTVLVQSRKMLTSLSKLSYRVKLIRSGVDLNRFHPVHGDQKTELRRRYGINSSKFIVLHIGHIKKNRNIESLKEVQRDNNQVIIIGSTSTKQDKNLVKDLQMIGVKVITDYLENIEEIYQLADCYVFPVTSELASIEIPLSVLEAMACNLPIITTKYGGLTDLFQDGAGFYFMRSLNDLSRAIDKVKKIECSGTRTMVEPYSWDNLAKDILDQIQ